MIQEFDLGLLRRKVWVAVNTNLSELNSLCVQIQEKIYGDINEDLYQDYITSYAITVRAYNKVTRDKGYLVILCRDFEKGSELVDCIAHEACHVSDFVQGDLGCTVTDTEINAHTTGYVAGKIMLTYNNEKESGNGERNESQPVAE